MRQRHSGLRFYSSAKTAIATTRREKGKPGRLGIMRKLLWSWWLWILIAFVTEALGQGKLTIGVAVFGFLCYLIAPGENVPRFGLDSKFPIQSHEFKSSMFGTTGIPFIGGNNVSILNNGDQFYPAMLEDIRRAEHTITMENYIFWEGTIARQFVHAMAERSRAGVQVKLLLDAFGSFSLGKDIRKLLTDSGGEVFWYNRMWLRTLGRFNHRDHRKSLIVDGRIAYTGGAGIADRWMGNAEDARGWHDIQIRVEGPGAVTLQTGFAQNWLETTGELLSGNSYFPPPDAAGTIATQTVFSSPKSGSSGTRIMYELSITSAQKTLYIANPYFIPDDSLVQILIEARKRGVDIRIMVSGLHNDIRISRYASQHLYGPLLEAGIEIYEYNRTMLHQKTMVVDTIWATVGTANFDNRSFALDEESNVCVYDRRIAEQLEAIFKEDLATSDRITLEQWRRRGIKARLLGVACVFLKEQI